MTLRAAIGRTDGGLPVTLRHLNKRKSKPFCLAEPAGIFPPRLRAANAR